MTLEALQYLVTDLALKRNLVNCSMSGPSIYAINPEDIKEYPLIFVSPTGSHTIKENTTRYSLTIFYMDRLFEDSSNEESITSAGIETLRNLKLQLSKIEVVTDIQDETDIRLFTETERMADRVAGAYMTIWIETLNPSTCPAFFDEYGYYMGNYFATEGVEAVLDSLASKEWVNRLIASISVSGITPEEFERIMGDYVLRRKFATINGSGITNNQEFNLVEQEDYTEQVQQIFQAISAATPSDYDEVKSQVSANTQNIADLSGSTSSAVSSLTHDIETLSAATSDAISAVSESISAVTSGLATEQYVDNAISGLATEQYVDNAISEIDDWVVTLSGYTSYWDVRVQAINYLIDKANSLTGTSEYYDCQYTKLRVFIYHTRERIRGWMEFHPYELTPDSISLYSVVYDVDYPLNNRLVVWYGTLHRDQQIPQGGLNQIVIDPTKYATTADTSNIINLISNKQDTLTAGDNITIQNNVISAAGNVSSTTIFTLTELTKAEYEQLSVKDPHTLYIIKPF